jgi:hypothetical protein
MHLRLCDNYINVSNPNMCINPFDTEKHTAIIMSHVVRVCQSCTFQVTVIKTSINPYQKYVIAIEINMYKLLLYFCINFVMKLINGYTEIKMICLLFILSRLEYFVDVITITMCSFWNII